MPFGGSTRISDLLAIRRAARVGYGFISTVARAAHGLRILPLDVAALRVPALAGAWASLWYPMVARSRNDQERARSSFGLRSTALPLSRASLM